MPDASRRSCELPQEDFDDDDEDAFIECRFGIGSIVWARQTGFPWWPAVVDIDPDTDVFVWTHEDDDKIPEW